ncbi:MAG: FAD-dependent oxidoreductase, partial [Bacteroidota bacterium]
LEKQIPCHIAYTSKEVHDILRTGFDRSPMFNGRIRGLGPRYCPSIEDKIDRFADKDRHQLFVEPEGWDTCEIYVNGFSSSLPEDVQYKAMRKIRGFENAKMFRPGYAIEYDFFPPTQLKPSLETRRVKNLFFAGQINGTTGYEEAASQGMMAGINAHQAVQEEEPLIVKRSEGYIGVLIDDLVNKGTKEPYRMFTSRAEYRILLRQDNADLRLTPIAQKLGVRGAEERMEQVNEKREASKAIERFFRKTSIAPDQINAYLQSLGSSPIKQKMKLHSILLRPKISMSDLQEVLPFVKEFTDQYKAEFINLAEINMKYEGYIKKEQDMVDKMNRLEAVRLYENFDYGQLVSLSSEAREKLSQLKPRTIGQASRISGVSPSDISVLLVHVGR